MRSGLRWGLKSSFVAYLLGLEDGTVTASDGAVFGTDRILVFPLADDSGFDAGTGRGVLAFAGTVAFLGHAGLLDVRLADLRLECAGSSVLTVAVGGSRLTLATLDLGASAGDRDALHWTDAPARLTREGSSLLNDVYRPGETLDPVSVWIDLSRR